MALKNIEEIREGLTLRRCTPCPSLLRGTSKRRSIEKQVHQKH